MRCRRVRKVLNGSRESIGILKSICNNNLLWYTLNKIESEDKFDLIRIRTK